MNRKCLATVPIAVSTAENDRESVVSMKCVDIIIIIISIITSDHHH